MTFHKEGYTSLALTILFLLVLNAVIQFYMPQAHTLKWIIYIFSFLFLAVIVQFFRSPFFDISTDETTVLCPADGKVVVIEEADETEYLKDKRIQLSVFMSPVNVHVNRNPIAGVVSYFKYHKGKYLVAWHPKSSTENERTTVVVQNSEGVSVLFRQIAGALARRIVWYVKEGDIVEQGQQFGFIKFGSRVDVFLPLGSKILVNIGDVVKGGRTVLAELPSALTAVTATEETAAIKPVSMESLTASAPVAEQIAKEEPTVIENEAHQGELPLVIDHPKAEEPKKAVKKAAPRKPAAAKATQPKGKKE
jgi:phosphatidylserine decarboxylase